MHGCPQLDHRDLLASVPYEPCAAARGCCHRRAAVKWRHHIWMASTGGELNQSYNGAVNRLMMRVTRRAEKAAPDYLARTFVPVEPVPSLLESLDNQVIYGRRGTGKTHLLKYLAETKKREGDVALYVDLRTIGSSSGLYADTSQPLGLRATNLLVDLIEELHNQIRELVENTNTFDEVLDTLIPSLDDIGLAATQVRVVGNTESSVTISAGAEVSSRSDVSVGLHGSVPSVSASASKRRTRSRQLTESRKQSGREILTVQFGMLGRRTIVTPPSYGRQTTLASARRVVQHPERAPALSS